MTEKNQESLLLFLRAPCTDICELYLELRNFVALQPPRRRVRTTRRKLWGRLRLHTKLRQPTRKGPRSGEFRPSWGCEPYVSGHAPSESCWKAERKPDGADYWGPPTSRVEGSKPPDEDGACHLTSEVLDGPLASGHRVWWCASW